MNYVNDTENHKENMALCKNLIFAQSLRHLMLNISKSGSCRLISRSTRNASNAPEEDSYDGGDRKTHFGFETVTEQEKEEKGKST